MLPGCGILRIWFLIFADHVHFARTTVKLQGQDLIAMDQLHRRGFPALDGAFRLLRAEVEGEPQTMLSDHHRHIALLFVRFIGGVDQLCPP